jgi:trehalose-6-phosphatase
MKNKIIAVDFDGTIVEHVYPDIGAPVEGALETMTALAARGHKLILWTMRSGDKLDAAVEYLKKNGIPLWGINKNPDQKTH